MGKQKGKQKKEWTAPKLQIFGEMATLTQQRRKKGQGSADCLQNSTANNNTGPCRDPGDSASSL